MAATNRRGATGVLRRSDLRALLRRANANPLLGLDTAALQGAVANFEENELAGRSLTPQPSAAVGGGGQGLLNTQQVTGLLLHLSTSSKMISELFSRYEVGGSVPLVQWLEFTRAEQLERCGDEEEVAPSTGNAYQDSTEMARRKQHFVHDVGSVGGDLESEETLSLLRFSLLLLSPRNDAIRDPSGPSLEQDKPLSSYWTATSHNSCTAVALETHAARFVHLAPRDFASHRCRCRG
eukprot:698825-Prymnesium_polylepis.3